MNILGIILGLALSLFTAYQVVGLIKDVKKKRALKKDKQKENNEEVNKE